MPLQLPLGYVLFFSLTTSRPVLTHATLVLLIIIIIMLLLLQASVHTVEDIMTKGKILTCNPDTLLDDGTCPRWSNLSFLFLFLCLTQFSLYSS